jgi:putative Holliday junction resolvase
VPEASRSAGSPQVILAFDIGSRRTGVASGNTLTRTAHGLTTLDCAGGIPWTALDRLLAEAAASRLLVGIPYNMDGTPTALTQTCRHFASELEQRYGLPVELVDERLSSREARGQLREARAAGLKARRVRRGDIDRTAAKVLLERWFAMSE